MTKRYLCLVAGQRAGTTALHSALGATGRFHTFREVFHTDPSESPETFLNFAKQRDLRVADLATTPQSQKIALDYLEYLRAASAGRIPILDIKLNSWSVLKPFWGYTHEMPFFMKVLLEEGAFFVFIRRRELVDQILSEFIAQAVGKWHDLKPEDVKENVTVNVAAVRSQARLIIQGENFLRSFWGPHSPILTIDYEELFPEGSVSKELLAELRSRFGIDLPSTVVPSIQKNEPDKRQYVSNYQEAQEVVAAVIGEFPRRQGRLGIQ